LAFTITHHSQCVGAASKILWIYMGQNWSLIAFCKDFILHTHTQQASKQIDLEDFSLALSSTTQQWSVFYALK
jgi:hypothetical protein